MSKETYTGALAGADEVLAVEVRYGLGIKNLPTDRMATSASDALELLRIVSSTYALCDAGFATPPRKGEKFPHLTRHGEMELGKAIMAGQQSHVLPLLAGEQAPLYQRAGIQARDKMVEVNTPLVMSIARKYRGVPSEVLVYAGLTGLSLAAERYDHRRFLKFSTVASAWISSAVRREFLANQYPGVAYNTAIKLDLLERTKRKASPQEVATCEQLAKRSGLLPSEIPDLLLRLGIMKGTLSLDVQIKGSKRDSLLDMVKVGDGSDAEQQAQSSLALNIIGKSLAMIPERYHLVYGIFLASIAEDNGLTSKDIGEITGDVVKRVDYVKSFAGAMLLHPSLGIAREVSENMDYEFFDEALCYGQDVELFFQFAGGKKKAKLCGQCAVRAECKLFAQERGFKYGFWGGQAAADLTRQPSEL